MDLQLPVQSVPINTNVVGSNPTHGEVYSIQHYVIKVVSFHQVFRVPPPINSDRHDITEILLKAAFITINHPIKAQRQTDKESEMTT